MQGITRDYKGIQWITRDYKQLLGISRDYKGLQGITRDYKGLHGIRTDYKGLLEDYYMCTRLLIHNTPLLQLCYWYVHVGMYGSNSVKLVVIMVKNISDGCQTVGLIPRTTIKWSGNRTAVQGTPNSSQNILGNKVCRK